MEASNQNDLLRNAVTSAVDRPEMIAAVHSIYERLQMEIDLRKPICVASGKCCHFDSYGHRLYVTTLELAAFAADLQSHPRSHIEKPALLPIFTTKADGCPLQLNGLCSVHEIRPFGCRIFFCDPTATDWQQELYERFHDELKRMHETFKVPYFYMEWRAALSRIGVSPML